MLTAWEASPERFREDANAEEDLLLAGLAGSLVAELAANAVDAARLAGVPARVLLRLTPHALECASTGAPLSPVGLRALASLRASAKRDEPGSVGRYGVGFAAVLAVTDEPSLTSGGAAVGFSAERTRAAVQAVPALREELARRGGAVPVLRLPFALPPGDVPAGYDTLVRLPLREPDLARALLRGTDRTLPLVLPGLAELVIDDGEGPARLLRVHERPGEVELDGRRWLLAEREVVLPERLRAGLRLEERGAGRDPGGSVRVLVPAAQTATDDAWPADVPRVLRAPQPTAEPLSLPVLVSAPVPLEPARAHVLAGPVRDHVLGVAADAVVELAARVEGPAVLRLVPLGLPAGEVDAVLCEAVLARLGAEPPLPGRLLLDLGPATTTARPLLDDVLDGLLPPGWPTAGRGLAALTALGVRRLSTADVVDALAGVDRPPRWWRAMWEALDRAPDHEALGALPVPLTGGRMAPGPRGLLLAAPATLEALAGLGPAVGDLAGLPVVHPEAATDALLGVGAVEAGPRVLLEALRPHVEASLEDDDATDAALVDLAATVLGLVAAAGVQPAELPWLAGLLLPDADGGLAPAADLVIGDGPLAAVLAPDAPLGVAAGDLVARHGRAALVACGVADGLGVVRGEQEVALLDGGEEWLTTLHDPGEVSGVRDLELLAWPQGLALLADVAGEARAYAAWWCDREPVLAGLLPREVLAPDADPLLAGLYDAPPPGTPAAALRLLGLRRDLPVEAEDLLDLLDRLGDASRTVSREQVRALHAHVARQRPSGEPPLAVRAVRGGRLVVVPPSAAVVVDRPDLLGLVGARAVVPVAAAHARTLARVLGVAVASDLGRYEVASEDPLLVLDADGVPTPVLWRLTPDGVLHAPTPAGRGRGQAWQQGRWAQRLGLVERLRDPGAAALLDAEDDL